MSGAAHAGQRWAIGQGVEVGGGGGGGVDIVKLVFRENGVRTPAATFSERAIRTKPYKNGFGMQN